MDEWGWYGNSEGPFRMLEEAAYDIAVLFFGGPGCFVRANYVIIAVEDSDRFDFLGVGFDESYGVYVSFRELRIRGSGMYSASISITGYETYR